MAIGNLQVIDIGLPNESTGSDSLFDAFTKTKTNFATLFACASPYATFANGTGIQTNTNSNTNTVTITNTGVVSLTAGDSSINLTGSNGNITITASGGGNGGGVSSVGVSSSTLSVSNSPVVSAGNITVNLPTTGITAGQYTNPTVTVDTYGRVTNIANNTVSGTVTSVGITPGTGILVTNSPITTSGNITVTNTGVTRISAGTGIAVSGSNGNVTISTTTSGGTVTGVTIASNNLTVSGGTITTSGTISIDLPSAITLTGNITGGNINTAGRVTATGNVIGGNIITAGVVSATGNGTFGNVSATTFTGALSGAATTAGSVTTAAQSNITSVGTLTSLSVSGNANIGNIGTGGLITATGNITGSNLITSGSVIASKLGITSYSLGSVSGAVTINANNGTNQTLSTNGSITLAFSNWPASGYLGTIQLTVTVTNTAHTITAPAAVSLGGYGIVGVNASTNVIRFAATGVYVFNFTTSNEGTTITMSENNALLRPYNASSEAITNPSNPAIDLGTTYSVYSPSPVSTVGTATLANGVAGQTKILGSIGSSTWTVTVASSSWGGSNQINFSGAGQTITLVWSDPLSVWLILNSHGSVTVS